MKTAEELFIVTFVGSAVGFWFGWLSIGRSIVPTRRRKGWMEKKADPSGSLRHPEGQRPVRRPESNVSFEGGDGLSS